MEADRMDWLRSFDDGPRPTRDRAAFFLAAVATGLGGAYLLLVFTSMRLSNPALRRFVDDPSWDHLLGGPTAVASLLAALLLTGWRSDKAWRARSMLLLTACVVGMGFWCVEHAHFLGWSNRPHTGGNDPLTILCLRSIALIRLVTLAELAVAAADVRGNRKYASFRAGAVGAAFLAYFLWLILALTHIDLGHRPPQWRDIRDPISFELLADSILLRGLSGGLAAILCGHAFWISHHRGQEEWDAESFSLEERPNIG